MARPLRIDVKGGWYHITARGLERRTIFPGPRFGEHFLELLAEMSERYGVEVHAYVLMGNHYHLLIRTPAANASAAIQWLNVSYSVWFNRKRNRVGPVFQGRFKSVLVEGDGIWLSDLSAYLHLNPVRIKGFQLGKADNQAEAMGLAKPSAERIRERLAALRASEWNSYQAYAGYAVGPVWLVTGELLKRAGGKPAYREFVESLITRGLPVERFDTMKARLVLGSTTFQEKARKWIGRVTGEQPDRKFAQRRAPMAAIIACVERVKGEKWEGFRDRHGDDGRNLALFVARKRSGLTLREIGAAAGGLEYKTVSKSLQYFEGRLAKDAALRRQTQTVFREISKVET